MQLTRKTKDESEQETGTSSAQVGKVPQKPNQGNTINTINPGSNTKESSNEKGSSSFTYTKVNKTTHFESHGSSQMQHQQNSTYQYSGGSYQGGSFQVGSQQGGLFQGGSQQGSSFQGGSSQGGSQQGGSFQGGSQQGGSFQGGSFQGGSQQGGSLQRGSSQGSFQQGSSYHQGGSQQGSSHQGGSSQVGSYQGSSHQGGSSQRGSFQGSSHQGGSQQGGSTHQSGGSSTYQAGGSGNSTFQSVQQSGFHQTGGNGQFYTDVLNLGNGQGDYANQQNQHSQGGQQLQEGGYIESNYGSSQSQQYYSGAGGHQEGYLQTYVPIDQNASSYHKSQSTYLTKTQYGDNGPVTFVKKTWATDDNGVRRNGSFSTIRPGYDGNSYIGTQYENRQIAVGGEGVNARQWGNNDGNTWTTYGEVQRFQPEDSINRTESESVYKSR